MKGITLLHGRANILKFKPNRINIYCVLILANRIMYAAAVLWSIGYIEVYLYRYHIIRTTTHDKFSYAILILGSHVTEFIRLEHTEITTTAQHMSHSMRTGVRLHALWMVVLLTSFYWNATVIIAMPARLACNSVPLRDPSTTVY